ncbi:hypothetical protein [Salinimicrobium flavum]|uniref:Uncharacterized protein n=1 Tax=Salinimicrobium flavum TaxID=1737065 RepID=A0ABW5ISS5_9FLAO
MSYRNLVILTKIILFYSLFYMFMKAVVIIFREAWVVPNLLLSVPFLILAVISWWQVKKEKYSWIFVFLGAAAIILTRIYERELAVWIQQQL